MKHAYLKISFLLLLLCANIYAQETSRVIVKLKNQASAAELSETEKSMYTGNAVIDEISSRYASLNVHPVRLGKKSNNYIYVITFPGTDDINKIIEEYEKSGAAEYAEPDYIGSATGVKMITPNDQYYFRQYALKNNGTFSLSPAVAGADIKMENAWNIQTGDTTVVVATIDSGCRLNHPEFTGRIWRNYAEIPNNGIDDDNNGRIDDVQGWDFANGDNNPTDDNGHGTNVTGIIGANGNNSIGYAGVDWKSKQMILKALDNNGSGYYSWWADAIYYATDNGARVINMSLAGQSASATLQNAVDYAFNNNVLVVAASGNNNTSTPYYPAKCNNVMAVGSTNPNDQRSNPFSWSSTSGSNYGSHISVVAPGNYIYGLDHQSNTNYNLYWSGTSQAAPHVAGLAALLLAQDKTRTPSMLRNIIETTADDQVGKPSEDVAGWDQYHGWGRINAFKALSLAVNVVEINNKTTELSVFPNPVSGKQFEITFHNPDNSPFSAEIYSAAGQLIHTASEIKSTQLHLKENISPGIYFLKILSGDQIYSTKFISK